MTVTDPFKLTYGTMFNPPEELHAQFEAALAKVRANLGQEHGMIIDGKDVFTAEKFEDTQSGQDRRSAGDLPKRHGGRSCPGAGGSPAGFPGLEPHPLAGTGQRWSVKRPKLWTSARMRWAR